MRNVLLLALVFLLLGCSGGGGGENTPGATKFTAADFTLSILPETYWGYTPECTWDLVVTETAATVTVGIQATEAAYQQALYFDLAYNPERLTPVSAGPADDVFSVEPLELAILDDRGTVHCGISLPNPTYQGGYSGSAVLATVTFTEVQSTASRVTGQVPVSDEAQVALDDDYPNILKWMPSNRGDYDSDGIVGVTDLVEVAEFYGESNYMGLFLPSTVLYVVDGSSDGVIDEADINVIRQNYGTSVRGGYRVYTSADPADYPAANDSTVGAGAELLATVPVPGGIDGEGSGYFYEYEVGSPDENLFYWVRPVDEAGNEGTPSEMITQIGLEAPRDDLSAAVANWNGGILRWYVYVSGDYDQDGMGTAHDLVPIGQYFGIEGPFATEDITGVSDGNQDGRIDAWDAVLASTRVWQSFQVNGYNIYSSTDAADYPARNDAPDLIPPVGFGSMGEITEDTGYQQRLNTYVQFADPEPGAYYWVRPVDNNGLVGTPSNLVGGP